MYKAMDVANYIINKSIDLEKPVSNLKLQKLLYYVQATSLVNGDERGMFEEDISAWKYGPVVEDVYHKFKMYANMPIRNKSTVRGVDVLEDLFSEKKYDPYDVILEKDKELIDRVIFSYIDYSALDMVRKTHTEQPWKESFEKGQHCISKKLIRNYYLLNPGQIL